MPDPRLVLWVALGGAIGAVLRYAVSGAMTTTGFPYGTLVVNVVGSFLLAFLLFHDATSGMLPRHMRAFIGIGILGAFTTMSTFSYETLALFENGETTKAGLNATLNFVLSLGAAVAGRAMALLLVDGQAT